LKDNIYDTCSLSSHWYYQSCCILDLTRATVQATGSEIRIDSLKTTSIYQKVQSFSEIIFCYCDTVDDVYKKVVLLHCFRVEIKNQKMKVGDQENRITFYT
jgi:hypothetical protein